MMDKVLVAYASKYGATAGIAEKIAEILREAGKQVDLLPVREVSNLDNYGTVVLGSAVYIGRWRRDAVKFLESQEEALKEKNVWFFSSGPAGEGDPVELLDGWTFPPLQQEIADRIQPRDVAVFHGVMDKEKMNFFENWILSKMDAPMGDFRDWEMIVSWADGIVSSMG